MGNRVEVAVVAAGSQVALGKALGVSQQAVNGWVKRGWVPLLRAKEIEAIFGIPRRNLVHPRFADCFSEDPIARGQ